MRSSTRITPIRQLHEVALRQAASSGGRIVAAFARERLAEAQEINRQASGRTPPHESFVNGARSENLEAIQPGRSIVFRFQLATEMFVWILDQLETHSPVRSGAYQKSHVFFADGTEANPAAPPEATEYVFLSTAPYSRKIERGLSRQAPDGVYQGVATLASRRFGNLARISFSYRSPIGSYLAGGANRAERSAMRGQRDRRAAMAAERESRAPAIIIHL